MWVGLESQSTSLFPRPEALSSLVASSSDCKMVVMSVLALRRCRVVFGIELESLLLQLYLNLTHCPSSTRWFRPSTDQGVPITRRRCLWSSIKGCWVTKGMTAIHSPWLRLLESSCCHVSGVNMNSVTCTFKDSSHTAVLWSQEVIPEKLGSCRGSWWLSWGHLSG